MAVHPLLRRGEAKKKTFFALLPEREGGEAENEVEREKERKTSFVFLQRLPAKKKGKDDEEEEKGKKGDPYDA